MVYISSAVYPLEVLPSQMYDSSLGEQKPLPSWLVDEIRNAAGSARVGIHEAIQTNTGIST